MSSETNIERLERIEGYFDEYEEGYNLIPSDIEWIIKVAKRVQELEEEIKSHAPEGRNYTNQQYVDLLLTNQRYKEALEEIGSREGDYYEDDCAQIALDALKKENE